MDIEYAFIAWFPDKYKLIYIFKPRQLEDPLIDFTDLAPTLIEIAGVLSITYGWP